MGYALVTDLAPFLPRPRRRWRGPGPRTTTHTYSSTSSSVRRPPALVLAPFLLLGVVPTLQTQTTAYPAAHAPHSSSPGRHALTQYQPLPHRPRWPRGAQVTWAWASRVCYINLPRKSVSVDAPHHRSSLCFVSAARFPTPHHPLLSPAALDPTARRIVRWRVARRIEAGYAAVAGGSGWSRSAR